MKIAMQATFPQHGIAERLTLYRELGIEELDLQLDREHPDLTTDVRVFLQQAAGLGIPARAVSPPWGWVARALKDPGEVDRLIKFIQEAPALGTHRVMLSCSMAKVPTPADVKAHLEALRRVYHPVMEVAESVGVDVCTHTSSQVSETLFSTVELIDMFLDAMGSRRHKLIACCGCLSVAGWNVPALIHHWRDRIGAVHLFNPKGGRGGFEEMRFDAGQLNIFEVMRALHEIDFRGAIIPHEYPPFRGESGREISDGWVAGYLRGLRQAVTYGG